MLTSIEAIGFWARVGPCGGHHPLAVFRVSASSAIRSPLESAVAPFEYPAEANG